MRTTLVTAVAARWHMSSVSTWMVFLALLQTSCCQLDVQVFAPAPPLVSGNPLSLICNFTYNSSRSEDYTVQWSRQAVGSAITDDLLFYNDTAWPLGGADVTGVLGIDGTFTLTLAHSNQSDNGTYTCDVTDTATSTNQAASVNVTIVSQCDVDPCQNNGTCLDVSDTEYTCTCEVGFTGFNCQTNIDDCTEDPCLNDGVCQDGVNGYTCDCNPCFNGTLCDNEIHNPCDSTPCQNGGRCNSFCTRISCDCNINWTGGTCNTPCNNIVNITADARVLLGRDHVVTCQGVTGGSVYWSESDTGIPQLAWAASYTLVTAGLQAGSRTLYCFVSKGTCTQRRATTVDVYWDFPVNGTVTENVTVRGGHAKVFTCAVDSDPPVTVRWQFIPAVVKDDDDEHTAGNDDDDDTNTTTTTTVAVSTTPLVVTPVDVTNATQNTSTLLLNDPDEKDSGTYVCIASLPGGVEYRVKVVNVVFEDDLPDKRGRHLPWWAILLIVLVVLAVLAAVAILVFIFVFKKGKGGAVSPSTKSSKHRATREDVDFPNKKFDRLSKSEENKYNGYNNTDDKDKPSTPLSYSVRYDKSREKGGDDPSPRPLPNLPEGGRGNALAPLDVEYERSKVRKKRRKRRDEKDPRDHDDQEDEDREEGEREGRGRRHSREEQSD